VRLRQIEYFVAIEEHGSYTKAAAELFVSQPSISQQILALEKELGAPLFDRVPTGIALTKAGAAFLPEAKTVLAAVERSRAAVRNSVAGVGGELTVVSIRSVASNVLPGSITAWHARHPETLLNLRDHHHRKLLETALEAGEGDVGIGPRPRNWDGTLHRIGFEEFVLVSSDKELLAAASADPATLSDVSWIVFDPSHGLSEVMELFFERYGITPRVAARSAQVEAAMSLALDGLGVTLLPENVVPLELRPVHTARAGAGVFRELVAYTKGQPSSLAHRYVDLLLEMDLPLRKARVPRGALTC